MRGLFKNTRRHAAAGWRAREGPTKTTTMPQWAAAGNKTPDKTRWNVWFLHPETAQTEGEYELMMRPEAETPPIRQRGNLETVRRAENKSQQSTSKVIHPSFSIITVIVSKSVARLVTAASHFLFLLF